MNDVALQQVEEIAKVPGVDVLLVGPWDLGNNINKPVLDKFHPDLEAAIERIRKAAVDNGKKSGIYCPNGEFAKRYAEQGFHMVWSKLFIRSLNHPTRLLMLSVVGVDHFRRRRFADVSVDESERRAR